MTDFLRDQLQTSLGAAYTIQRELGGGGMSRVFLADETALGRQVVVKLLAPELAAGISAERFAREIKLAASLQQANIVPVLSAGETNGLPFYTMPFVEGESLRHRLGSGAFPIAETIGILRDVAKALAYAHARGIVHRDIKPDNVLLSGGTAVVTDFGIAKALGAARSASATGGALTGLGSAIGTPAYMAPEQAAGDPDADHRIDLYAFGCLAYELLAGAAPFHGLSPQKQLAAHMTERPRAIGEVRPDVPPALAQLVMRSLEKEPDARPQSANELTAVLDNMASSPSIGALPAAMMGAVGLRKALTVYGVTFAIVAVLAKAATAALDVPDWVFPAALALMALGLPIVLLTAWVQRVAMHAVTRTPTLTPGGSTAAPGTLATMALRAAPVVSWRRTRRLGIAAATLFLLTIVGVMVLRQLGVGPAASLFAAGTLDARTPLLVADFRSVGDTSLGTVMSDAVRSDLGQSRSITLLGAERVTDALRRMQRSPTSRIDLPLAREIAAREGVAAIVDGEVRQIGTSYLLTLRLVRADSATELAAFRATVADAGTLVETLGDLTRKLRGRMGESLREVRASGSLEQVTTSSLDALRKFSAAVRARSLGDTELAVQLLEEAIVADTGFASAYARIATYVAPTRSDPDRVARMVTAAHLRRDRLTEVERLYVETEHAYHVLGDMEAALRFSRQRVELEPNDRNALHNLAIDEGQMGNLARAESLYRRVIALSPSSSVIPYGNLTRLLMVARWDRKAVDSVLAERRRAMPNARSAWTEQVDSLMNKHDYATFERLVRDYCDKPGNRAGLEATPCTFRLQYASRARGILGTQSVISPRALTSRLIDSSRTRLVAALDKSAIDAWMLGDRIAAARVVDSLERSQAISRLPERNRPYDRLVWVSLVAGRPADARRYLAAFERQWPKAKGPQIDGQRAVLRGWVALAEGKARDAVVAFQAAESVRCANCTVNEVQIQNGATPMLAYAQDLSGDAKGAEETYDRFLARGDFGYGEAIFVAGAYKRVGELAEARGDVTKAAASYRKFVEIWKDADPRLQPKVQEARERLARLQVQGRRKG